MHRARTLVISVIALATLALAAAGVASPASSAAPKVKITLKEFKLAPAPKSVKAGPVTFAVSNAGSIAHEVVVIKTDAAPGSLPVTADRVSEKAAVGEVPDVAPGASKQVTLNLKAGKYVLLCNLKGHYKLGQWSAFTVK
jgi:uncharacterized cupredoxin-like copper-binding protein